MTTRTKAPKSGSPSLGRRALHGLAWTLGQSVVSRATGLLSQMVLAALLHPEDFGIIGIAYSVSAIASTLLNVGVDDVVLQRQRALRLWAGPALWISASLASFAGFMLLLAAPLAAIIFKMPELVGILAVLALSMPLGAGATVPTIVLRSRMQFGVLSTYGAVETVAQAILTVVLAWRGFGAYSFVLPAPIFALVRSVVLWRFAAFRMRYEVKRRYWRYLIGNTAANFTNRVLLTLMGQGDYVILGLVASQAVVGSYYFGFRLAAQPLWILAGNIGGVLLPALVQLKAEPERQGQAACLAATLLMFLVMPAALLEAAAAAPFVHLLFGERWNASIPTIQLLSLALALDAPSWLAGALLAARGEFTAGLRYLLMQAPVFFVLVGVGAVLGEANGVAIGILLYNAVTQPSFVYLVYRRVGVSLRQVAAIYLRPGSYAAVAVGIGLALSLLTPVAGSPLARILIIGIATLVIYTLSIRLLAPDIWDDLLRRLTRAVRRQASA
jgi:O-antigen/teichoic acid export membrane protein